jgi:aspartyl-tRNA(Asn)/glutamyl-tRNA(Gln) amidotransferase subunit B
MRYQAAIGLEVHAQLLTSTKAFCGCSAKYGALPNTQVCPVCLGLPGALPVLNGEAVRMAVRTALALECTIQAVSRFARKNYFYPDLPKGYQISQYDEPFSLGGHLDIDVDGQRRTIGITRVHMEEDAGKSMHHAHVSVVDLNRSGVPLVEIVGEPDLRTAAEAAEYLRTLRDVLVFIGVNDGNLEEGSFRCDANVSIRPPGQTKLGARVELKNINSFRFVERAIDHEIARQAAVLDANGAVAQETRGYREDDGTTFSLRSKEEAQDYRYFPDPDLPPLVLDEAFVHQIRAAIPELPRAKKERFVAEMGLSASAAQVLTSHPRVAAFFEEAATLRGSGAKVANFVLTEVLRDVTTHGLDASIPIVPRQLAALIRMVDAGTISGKQAKEVYSKMAGTSRMPEEVVAALGMQQVTNTEEIEAVCRRVVEANPRQAEQLKAGKAALFGFFVGQVMKETRGAASPAIVNETLKRLLGVA